MKSSAKTVTLKMGIILYLQYTTHIFLFPDAIIDTIIVWEEFNARFSFFGQFHQTATTPTVTSLLVYAIAYTILLYTNFSSPYCPVKSVLPYSYLTIIRHCKHISVLKEKCEVMFGGYLVE